MITQEEAYAMARRGDMSGMNELHAATAEANAADPAKASVTSLPKSMDALVAAVQSSGWEPVAQAQMLGAYFFDVDTQRTIAEAARALGEAGKSAGDLGLEARIVETHTALKVKAEAERRLAAESFTTSQELSWDDLEDAGREYLVADLVPQGGIVFLCARSNIGKTFTYIDMVARMATGMPWLGKATRPAKTLIVLGEGKAGFMSRLRGWMVANGKTPDDLRPYLAFIDGANLNNDESLARIREVAEREGSELVIFDTWAGTSGVHKEDDAALNSATLNRVEAALPGRTLFFVHHPRKAEQDTDTPVMRGSGALDGRADVVMMMYRDRKFIPATGETFDYVALSTEAEHNGKNRDAQTETIRGLYLDEIEVGEGDISRALRQVGSETISREAREVRKLLTRSMSAAEFLLVFPGSRSTAFRYLKLAVEDGVARKEAGPLGTELYVPTQNWSELLSKTGDVA